MREQCKQQKDRERNTKNRRTETKLLRATGGQRKIHTALERDKQGKREKGRQSDRAANQYVPLSHPSILLESANHVETLPCCRSITLEPPIPPPSRLSNPSGKTFHERLNTKGKQLGTPHHRPSTESTRNQENEIIDYQVEVFLASIYNQPQRYN